MDALHVRGGGPLVSHHQERRGGMMRQLIFVHGRSQQEKDSLALKGEWIAAWEKGLAKSNLSRPIEDKDIHFPYYGDTLFQMVGGKNAAEVAEVIVRGPPPRSAE